MFRIASFYFFVFAILCDQIKSIKICQFGYWDQKLSICVSCQQNCLSCDLNGCLQKYLQQTHQLNTYHSSLRLLLCNSQCGICVGSTCSSCIDGYAFNGGGNCLICHSLCLTCTAPNDAYMCSSCVASLYVDASNYCASCSSAFGSNCQQCTASGCTNCAPGTFVSGTGCIVCSSSICLTCTASTCLTCQPYYSVINSTCSDTCGDNHTISLPCDNQIGIPFDGCSDICSVMYNFQCSVTGFTTLCSYIGNIVMNVLSIVEQLYSNQFTLVVSLFPPLHAFINTDLTQLFKINYPGLTIQSMVYSNGNLTIQISYSQTIRNQTFQIIFTPSLSTDPRFSLTPNSVLDIIIPSQIFAYYYSPFILKLSNFLWYYCIVLVVLSWIVFFIGILTRKLAGLQLMFVLQFAWLMLLWLPDNLPPAFYKCEPLKYACFYSLSTRQPIYSTILNIQSIRFKIDTQYFPNNVNFAIILYGIPLLGAIISKILTLKQGFKQKAIQKYEQFLEMLMYGTMCNLIGLTLYSYIFFASSNEMANINSLFVFCLSLLITCGTFIKFYYDPDPFAKFRYSFNVQILAMNYYFVYIVVLVMSVLLMGFFNKVYWMSILPPGIFMLFTICFRPYRQNIQNLRSFFYLLLMALSAGLRTLYSLNTEIWRMSDIPTIILTVLIGACTLAVIWAYIQVIRSMLIPEKQPGSDKKQKLEYNLFQDMKLMQDICDPQKFKKLTGLNPLNPMLLKQKIISKMDNQTELDEQSQTNYLKYKQKKKKNSSQNSSSNSHIGSSQQNPGRKDKQNSLKNCQQNYQYEQLSEASSVKNQQTPKPPPFKLHDKSIIESLFSYNGTLKIQDIQKQKVQTNLIQNQTQKQINNSTKVEQTKIYTETDKQNIKKVLRKQMTYIKFKNAAALVKPKDQQLMQAYQAI